MVADKVTDNITGDACRDCAGSAGIGTVNHNGTTTSINVCTTCAIIDKVARDGHDVSLIVVNGPTRGSRAYRLTRLKANKAVIDGERVIGVAIGTVRYGAQIRCGIKAYREIIAFKLRIAVTQLRNELVFLSKCGSTIWIGIYLRPAAVRGGVTTQIPLGGGDIHVALDPINGGDGGKARVVSRDFYPAVTRFFLVFVHLGLFGKRLGRNHRVACKAKSKGARGKASRHRGAYGSNSSQACQQGLTE